MRASHSLDTSDWELHAFVDWKAKSHAEECDECHGHGEVGGGFKDIDGARRCTRCHGTGNVLRGPTTPKPDIPEALVEHMRRAWWDYFNTKPATHPAPAGEPAMPEPEFQLRWQAERARYTVSKPRIGNTDVYTADQLRAYGDARAEHARREALDVGVRTGHPPGLLQDDDKKLSKWLASRPDSMRRAREAVEAVKKENTR